MNKDQFFLYCLTFLGLPYRWGGDDPIGGVDCSGLVLEVLKALGLAPSQAKINAQAIHDYFVKQKYGLDVPGPGSLCFYGQSPAKITHVGILVSPGAMLTASGGTSETTSLDKAIQQNAFVKIRPHNYRKDFLRMIKPQGLLW